MNKKILKKLHVIFEKKVKDKNIFRNFSSSVNQYILRKVYDNYVNKIKEELGYD